MSSLSVTALVHAQLDWSYQVHSDALLDLYEKAKRSQWNASTDIDWSVEVPFGSPLGDAGMLSPKAFERSPLARGGKPLWNQFCWEQQAWMVCQFLHGEQGALLASARLTELLPDLDCKFYAASQVADEARHVETFSRYVRDKLPHGYAVSRPLEALLREVLQTPAWDLTALGMQVVIEPLALGAFRTADRTLHDPLIRQIVHYVARDEARHIAFGIHLLRQHMTELSSHERREREDFLLTAADLMVKRLLLDDVWERMGVDRRAGAQFAATDEVMTMYRTTVFSKVVSTLERIGLWTPYVAERLAQMGVHRLGGTQRRTSE
jgi:hypothetical protein